MSVSDPKAPGGVPGKPVTKPTKPGHPVAPSQPEVEGTDPTVPTAPTPDQPPETPTDPTNPTDPTVPVEPTTADPVLELPPEGMLRISKTGKEDQFVFPVHADRWAADGWKVHPPVTIEGNQPGTADLPLASAPLAPLPEAIPEALPGELPEEAVNLPGDLTGEAVTVPAPIDYSAMTKAQIIAEVQTSYGVLLDSSLTKPELVAEAEALAAKGAVAEAALPAAGLEPVPGLDAPLLEADVSVPADLLV